VILSAGLSPAWQQILKFDAVRRGEVNRARETAWCASGKVINVAVAMASLKEQATLISAIGGLTGDAIQRETDRLGIHCEWIQTIEPSRVCTTILEADATTTELVENMPEVTQAVLVDFVDRTRVYANVADVTILTGSLPAQAPIDLFARIVRNSPMRFVLDLQGPPLLACLAFQPFLVKPNREELWSTLGQPVTTDMELLGGMRTLQSFGAQWVVVSDGPRGVFVVGEDVSIRLQPPQMNTVNPIGCGDCLAAGIAIGIRHGQDVVQAVRFGMGCAAQNVENLLPARLDRGRCEELAERVLIEEFGQH
jgi:1-phosphofructokinase family hexose kinase